MSDLMTGLLMCRSTAASGLGGPVWRVRAMLKQLRYLHPDNVTLRGVLCDGLYTSVEALPPLVRPTPVTDAKVRAAANFVGTAAASVPNLLKNLRRAVDEAPGDIVFDCHDFVSTYMAQIGRAHV